MTTLHNFIYSRAGVENDGIELFEMRFVKSASYDVRRLRYEPAAVGSNGYLLIGCIYVYTGRIFMRICEHEPFAN